MQVKVVWHHGGAQDPDAYVEHFLVPQHLGGRHKPGQHGREAGLGEEQLQREARSDGENQRDHQRLHVAKPFVLQVEHREHVQRCDQAAPHQRNAEKQLQRDGRADDLRQIAGGNGQLAQHPEEPHHRPGVMVPAGLRQVAPGGHAQLDAQVLEQDRHEVGQQDDEQERIAKLRAPRQVGGPIPRVHVAHCHQKARPGKRPHLLPERQIPRHRDGAVHLGQADRRRLAPPR